MKRLLAGTAVLGLAVAGIGTASAQPAIDKVTGGGQIIVDTTESPASGPGDTIAFNAQSTDDDPETDLARGQVQFVDRGDDNTGKFHGEVDCLVVEGNRAHFAGVIRDNDGDPDNDERFRIDVRDRDAEGSTEDDMVLVVRDANADCDDAFNASEQLGRGNVTIHRAKS